MLQKGLSRSAKRYHKVCFESNEYACLQLAGNYYTGIMMPQDFEKARLYFTQACTLKDNSGLGCYYLSQMYYGGNGVKKSRKKAEAYARKACSLGHREACYVVKTYFSKK